MYKRVSGTKDILPDETGFWQELEEKARLKFSLYNYSEIRPPLIEEASLFDRSLGASTEIVQKQMFLIKNKEEVYALRPEATASIVRAYIENNLDKTAGFSKFYYIGPMFRLERPQKGRLRQFHHIGCEAIGSGSPELDVEIISLAESLLKEFGVSGYKIKINTLGCPEDKAAFARGLREKLAGSAQGFCQDCQGRLEKNVLRVLDCKEQACRRIVEGLALCGSHVCAQCQEHFDGVKRGLDALNIAYEVSPLLVRGLDYYTRTVFELSHPDLGAQDALGAGGRYNDLVKDLGGSPSPAVGFAFGMERVMLVLSASQAATKKGLVYLITLGKEACERGSQLLAQMRQNGITCDRDYESRSVKGAMRRANDLGAGRVLILGEDELKKNCVTLRDMASSQQKEVALDQLLKELKC